MKHSKISTETASFLSIRYFAYVLTGLLLAGLFFPLKAAAQGDLLITPRRIVFDGKKRSVKSILPTTVTTRPLT